MNPLAQDGVGPKNRETARAVTDFNKVFELSDDPDLRRHAEENLKALGTR